MKNLLDHGARALSMPPKMTFVISWKSKPYTSICNRGEGLIKRLSDGNPLAKLQLQRAPTHLYPILSRGETCNLCEHDISVSGVGVLRTTSTSRI
jgi:hypothetical protein